MYNMYMYNRYMYVHVQQIYVCTCSVHVQQIYVCTCTPGMYICMRRRIHVNSYEEDTCMYMYTRDVHMYMCMYTTFACITDIYMYMQNRNIAFGSHSRLDHMLT